MKNIVVIGGSKGIGREIVSSQINLGNKCYNFSRSNLEISHNNLVQEKFDILNDELPPVENIDALIYCPGSINLKPILQLKEEDFINDFNINVLHFTGYDEPRTTAVDRGGAGLFAEIRENFRQSW